MRKGNFSLIFIQIFASDLGNLRKYIPGSIRQNKVIQAHLSPFNCPSLCVYKSRKNRHKTLHPPVYSLTRPRYERIAHPELNNQVSLPGNMADVSGRIFQRLLYPIFFRSDVGQDTKLLFPVSYITLVPKPEEEFPIESINL